MAKLYAKSPSGEDALLSISITGFTQSLQQNGWCKFPNGLLFQWSKANLYSGTFVIKPNLWFAIAIVTHDQGNYTANGMDSGFTSIDFNGWKSGRRHDITQITISQ